MSKIKRRDFLKYVGLAVACPAQLLKSKEKKCKGGIVRGHMTSLMLGDGIELLTEPLQLIGTDDYIEIDVSKLESLLEGNWTVTFSPNKIRGLASTYDVITGKS